MFSKVIVPLDGSQFAEAAIGPASTLARQFGATVVVVTSAPAAGYAYRSDYLDQIASAFTQPVETKVLLSGSASFEIMDEAIRQAPSLICMASHARGPLGDWVLGSVAEDILRTWAPPLVVVGPHCADAPPSYDEIVVPLDGSDLAAQVLPVASQWARTLHAKVDVVEVIDPDALEQAEAAGVDRSDILESSFVGRVAESLEHDGVSATWDVLHGEAAEAIASHLVTRPSSIVAMTTHGRSGLRLVAAGSVATKVIHDGHRPVLLLGPGA